MDNYRFEFDKNKFLTELLSQEKTMDYYEMMHESLFYVCCGIDPTPIFAFEDKISLYVYADNFAFMGKTFQEAIDIFYGRLAEKYTLIGRDGFRKYQLCDSDNAELTTWKTKSGKLFCVLYIKQDYITVYREIYYNSETDDNYIVPKCICNYRYEFDDEGYRFSYMNRLCRTCQYILGHSFNVKYKEVALYKCYSDYASSDEQISLFKRRYYMLF